MPPKPKESGTKKPVLQVARLNISDASLNFIPNDALEGFQERIETGINWTLIEEAARYHRERCTKEIPVLTFSEALQNKIQKSILHGFLAEDSKISLREQWEILLPITIWDNERCSNEEGKICFNNINSITDDVVALIKRAVHHDDREFLKRELKMVTVLRVTDSEMTELDASLKDYRNLSTLNLCGNFISSVDAKYLPEELRMLELKANRINDVSFAGQLPRHLIYLGLSRNFLYNDNIAKIAKLPFNISVLDLSDNDICDLEVVLAALSELPNLVALHLAGNPCSVCTAYARTTLSRLPRLQWLDSREVLPTDRRGDTFEPNPDDLRSAYFNFTVIRIMGAMQPPKTDKLPKPHILPMIVIENLIVDRSFYNCRDRNLKKGTVATFHVEVELPLLDSMRRMFLMFRHNDLLVELMPPPEDRSWSRSPRSLVLSTHNTLAGSSGAAEAEVSSNDTDIYKNLQQKNSREIIHYTVFESNRVQWSKIMNFQEPTVRIFCPNLTALRDTFRSVITVRFVYTLNPDGNVWSFFSGNDSIKMVAGKQTKSGKSSQSLRPPGEYRLTVATVKCSLKQPDWSQSAQHFHWDDTLGTDEAIHWGDGDLSVLQYTQQAVKTVKGKFDSDQGSTRQSPTENLTCHFGFGIDTLK